MNTTNPASGEEIAANPTRDGYLCVKQWLCPCRLGYCSCNAGPPPGVTLALWEQASSQVVIPQRMARPLDVTGLVRSQIEVVLARRSVTRTGAQPPALCRRAECGRQIRVTGQALYLGAGCAET
jgi:hypothetical protein